MLKGDEREYPAPTAAELTTLATEVSPELELVEPGLVYVNDWKACSSPDRGSGTWDTALVGGVARKPEPRPAAT